MQRGGRVKSEARRTLSKLIQLNFGSRAELTPFPPRFTPNHSYTYRHPLGPSHLSNNVTEKGLNEKAQMVSHYSCQNQAAGDHRCVQGTQPGRACFRRACVFLASSERRSRQRRHCERRRRCCRALRSRSSIGQLPPSLRQECRQELCHHCVGGASRKPATHLSSLECQM